MKQDVRRRGETEPTDDIIYKIVIVGLCIAIFAILAGVVVVSKKRNDEYNKHICSVYGYQEDCKTPLEK
jgi:hypothetical protein